MPVGETGPPEDAEPRDEPPREGVRSGMMGSSLVVGPSNGGVRGEYDICAAAEWIDSRACSTVKRVWMRAVRRCQVSGCCLGDETRGGRRSLTGKWWDRVEGRSQTHFLFGLLGAQDGEQQLAVALAAASERVEDGAQAGGRRGLMSAGVLGLAYATQRTSSSSHHLPPEAPPNATPRPTGGVALLSRRDRGGLGGSIRCSCGCRGSLADCHLGRAEDEEDAMDDDAAGGAYGWCRYCPWWLYDWALRDECVAVAMVNRRLRSSR